MSNDGFFEIPVDALAVRFFPDCCSLGAAAAAYAADGIRLAVRQKGEANLLLATGNSQMRFLAALRKIRGLPWQQVNIFHLDEYIGLAPSTRPGSRIFCAASCWISSAPERSIRC
jgi:glucosamine-6-phosphate deaminase